MANLKGNFDPERFNSFDLAFKFTQIVVNQLNVCNGNVNFVEAFKELLDNLLADKIIS